MLRKNPLTNENIVTAVEEVERFMAASRVDDKEILRIRLAVEEALLNYRKAMGMDARFSLLCIKRLGRLRIELRIPGDRLDPFAVEEEGDELLRGILAGMGIAPVWRYKNGVNLVMFLPQKRSPSQIRRLAASVAWFML